MLDHIEAAFVVSIIDLNPDKRHIFFSTLVYLRCLNDQFNNLPKAQLRTSWYVLVFR